MPQDYSQFQGEDYAYTPQGAQQPNLLEGVMSALEGFRAAREGRIEEDKLKLEKEEAKRLLLEDRELKRRGQEADIDYRKAQKDALLGKGTGASKSKKPSGSSTSSFKDLRSRSNKLSDSLYEQLSSIQGLQYKPDPNDYREEADKIAEFEANKKNMIEGLVNDPLYISRQKEYASVLKQRQDEGDTLSHYENEFMSKFFQDGSTSPELLQKAIEGESGPASTEAATAEPVTKQVFDPKKLQSRTSFKNMKDTATAQGGVAPVSSNQLLTESLFGKQEGFQDQTPTPTQGPLKPKMLSSELVKAKSPISKSVDSTLESAWDKTGEFFGKLGSEASEVMGDMASRGAGELVQLLKGNPTYVHGMVKDNISPSEQNGIKNVLGNPEENAQAIMELADTIDENLESPYLTKEGVATVLELSGRGGSEKLDLETGPEVDRRGRTAEDRSIKRTFNEGEDTVRRSLDSRGKPLKNPIKDLPKTITPEVEKQLEPVAEEAPNRSSFFGKKGSSAPQQNLMSTQPKAEVADFNLDDVSQDAAPALEALKAGKDINSEEKRIILEAAVAQGLISQEEADKLMPAGKRLDLSLLQGK